MQIFTADNGTLYTKTPTGTTLTGRTVPTGLTARSNRPSFAKYRRVTVCVGRFDRGLTYRDDLDSFHVLGIAAPVSAPVLASGGGSGSISGDMVGYFTYVHKSGSTTVLESAPGPASNTLSVSGVAQINWSAILGTAPSPDDARVTHIRLYRSVAGASARNVTEFAIGPTTYSDTVATLSLGSQMVAVGGVPPYVTYNCTYKKRMYYGGDPTFPDRIWYSEQEIPESVDALNFFKTTSGEAVTGLGTFGDYLVIFTANTADVHREHTTGDFSLRQVSPSIGCISHWSIVNIHDRLWFASQAGIYVYDGGFRYALRDLRSYWKQEYAANRAEYELCFAGDDRPEYCYILSIPFSNRTYRWVAYYLPFEPIFGGGEAQPWWFFDQRTRVDKSLGLLSYGGQRQRLYVGSDDGYLRQEDVDANADDDSDTYAKAVTLQTKHYLMDEPGGDRLEGKNLLRAWSYVEGENNSWVFKAYAGDETAPDQVSANWTDTTAASAAAGFVGQTVHPHLPERVTGRGFTFIYTASSPVGWKWRGLGGTWTLGDATRGRNS